MSTIGVNNHTSLIAPSQGLFPPTPPPQKKERMQEKTSKCFTEFYVRNLKLIKHRQKWAKIKANFVLNRLPDRIANTWWRILHSFLVKFRYLKISSLFFNWILHLVQFPSHKTLQKKNMIQWERCVSLWKWIEKLHLTIVILHQPPNDSLKFKE